MLVYHPTLLDTTCCPGLNAMLGNDRDVGSSLTNFHSTLSKTVEATMLNVFDAFKRGLACLTFFKHIFFFSFSGNGVPWNAAKFNPGNHCNSRQPYRD